MKRLMMIGGLIATAALAYTFAFDAGLKLKPGTIGKGAIAEWQTTRGGGAANHVLVLEKKVPTSEYEAAGADIQKIAGTPVANVNALAWTNLTPATAGGGSPRWVLYYGPAGGDISGYTFLEPTVSDTNNDGTIDQSEIQANPYFVGAAIAPGDEVKYLQIIVDEQERVILDDIKVRIDGRTTTFSGPGNSN